MVNIYARNYRVLRRVGLNWRASSSSTIAFLVLFLEKSRVQKGGERGRGGKVKRGRRRRRRREGKTGRRISRNWKKRYEINRRCLSDDEEVEINLDPNLLILSTR